jgi:hypothetical protein
MKQYPVPSFDKEETKDVPSPREEVALAKADLSASDSHYLYDYGLSEHGSEHGSDFHPMYYSDKKRKTQVGFDGQTHGQSSGQPNSGGVKEYIEKNAIETFMGTQDLNRKTILGVSSLVLGASVFVLFAVSEVSKLLSVSKKTLQLISWIFIVISTFSTGIFSPLFPQMPLLSVQE